MGFLRLLVAYTLPPNAPHLQRYLHQRLHAVLVHMGWRCGLDYKLPQWLRLARRDSVHLPHQQSLAQGQAGLNTH